MKFATQISRLLNFSQNTGNFCGQVLRNINMYQNKTLVWVGPEWWMLKAPLIKSLGLHISVFQNKSERGALNMLEKYV